MSLSSDPNAIDRPTLADLLKPMEFKAMLLVTRGLRNCQVAEFLGTTELVIENVLRDVCGRTGCWNSGDLVRRYFREVASGLLELGRLQRQLAELEARAALHLHPRPSGLGTATDHVA
jgi:DNA-binding CsgD family transcriptional regulator